VTEAALREGIRVTAASSLVLFVATFAASSLVALWPTRASKWLLRNRRELGLSVFSSQLVHGGLVIALARGYPGSFWANVATSTLVGGLLGYALLALMAATSFDRAVKWLGRRRWRALHTTGMYYLWVVFATSYGGRAAEWPYALFVALLVGVLGLRAAARLRRGSARRRGLTAPASPPSATDS
jgi:DMSO/TMAO reductase YedYZ heme-binding membrane subunit